jgi:hypothetical protein
MESPSDGGGDLGSQEQLGKERGEREGLDWVGLTNPDPSRLGSPSQVGWARPMCQGPISILNPN